LAPAIVEAVADNVLAKATEEIVSTAGNKSMVERSNVRKRNDLNRLNRKI
jgi:IS1 family transposase